MVVIRLARGGAKKAPFYQIVAADKRDPRDGRFIEKLGYFNPMARGQATRLEVHQERMDYWISKGAQPSERVSSLLKKLKKDGVPTADVATRGQARKEQAESGAAVQAAKAKKDADEAAKQADAEKKAATKKADAEKEAEAPADAGKADDAAKAE